MSGLRTTWTFSSASQLIFGRGAVRQLRDVVARFGTSRLFIVTDPKLILAGVVEQVRTALKASGFVIEVFDGGEPEPSLRAAEECLDAARRFEAQTVLGLGGGSNMDLAKATAAALSWGWYAGDYLGEDRVPGPILPLICVPTTAGTGSEVSAGAVLTDLERGLKVAMMSNFLRPAVAVVDPLLTVSCPAKVTADSGIDALAHAIEAYTAVDYTAFPLPPEERSVYQGKNVMGDVMAERAITLVGKYLRRAVADGTDLEAREGMALAAVLGGLAFSNVGVALVHALEYPIGAATHCSHGAGNGLLLPAVMRFNLPTRRTEFAQVARLLGEETAALGEGEAAERAVAAVDKLCRDIGIPARLSELGVKAEQLRDFAEKAHGIRRILRVNPRTATVAELEGLLKGVL